MTALQSALHEGAGCGLLMVVLGTWIFMAGCTAVVVMRLL